MAQLSKDLFAIGDRIMSIEEAVGLLSARVPPVGGFETVDLFAAEGRILARDLIAPFDLPRFDNSAVDGYAVRSSELLSGARTRLKVAGRIAAGHALSSSPPERTCLRIFTGAPLPAGFDRVFMQEDCALEDDATVVLPAELPAGTNCRQRGEDLTKGASALGAGRRLTPEDIGLAAALGQDRLSVRRQIRAAIFSAGDEIVQPGAAAPEAGVYDANRFMLAALLRRQGVDVTDLGVLADNREAIASALWQAAHSHDLVVTSGGVSAGDADHVKAALGQNGSLVFWRLAIKPGRPVAMGILAGKPFVGLPGNPVAVFVTFVYVLRPLIAALSGALYERPRALEVIANFSLEKKPGRREFVRASLRKDQQGRTVAEIYPASGSASLPSLTRTHGLVELAETTTRIRAGDGVGFLAYDLLR